MLCQKRKAGKSGETPLKKNQTEPVEEMSTNASPRKRKKSRNGENHMKFKSWQVMNSELV